MAHQLPAAAQESRWGCQKQRAHRRGVRSSGGGRQGNNPWMGSLAAQEGGER
jgi:hypothetical protein